MGRALYRKYRSKSLSDVVGQNHITDTLNNALKQNKISHAYLFTGPRGVGKTSVARILAHNINDLDYDEDRMPTDIIEIDAASNRRIDEIRELRDKVYVSPAQAKYKIYIIDEVHMLTTPAFNALLKTLEEPPEHVVFILATTDAHKLPETIISRTQRFSFRPISNKDIVSHLQSIAASESIEIDDAALELIAQHSEGSFRDAISLLDQTASRGVKVSTDLVNEIVGLAPAEMISAIVKDLLANNTNGVVDKLKQLFSEGLQAQLLAVQLSAALRQKLMTDSYQRSKEIVSLLKDLIVTPSSNNPEQYLELTLIDFTLRPKQNLSEANIIDHEPEVVVEALAITEPDDSFEKTQPTKKYISNKGDDWALILKELKQRHNTLYGVVRMAEPKFDNNKVILAFEFAFHEKKVNQTSNKNVIKDVVQKITGQDYEIECILDKTAQPPKLTITKVEQSPSKPNDLSTISNIFEGAELLES